MSMTVAKAEAIGQSRLLKNSTQRSLPIIFVLGPPRSSGMTNSPTEGGYIKLFTEYKRYKLYNEVIYRGKYKSYNMKFNPSIDYTVAFSLKFRNLWSLKVRGENLFNTGYKSAYVAQTGEKGSFQVNDRRFTISLEKVF